MLVIAGPRLLVSGAIFTDRLIFQELTDYITLGSHPTDPDRGLRRVAQVIFALKECIQDLANFYTRLRTDADPNCVVPAPNFPHYTKFTINNCDTMFTYLEDLTPVTPARTVFLASINPPSHMAGKHVVVKFTRTYCPEAHRLLAKLSLAPELLHHEVIEGAGIHLVVMEWIDAKPETDLSGSSDDSKRLVESLRQAVCALHGAGFVFGDLREPNILAVEGRVKLVDFDWCGEEGEVRYPATLPELITWPEGVIGEGRIMRAHDKAWFKRLTDKDL